MAANDAKDRLVVLAIAGFDPSGGAGIIADIRTIQSFGCTSVAAITSITFQNSARFRGAIHQSAESIRAQLEAILGEHKISAIKIGMLPTGEVIREVARMIRERDLPAPVVDPVMKSTSGGKLMSDDAFEVLVTELLPLARVVTPNIPEAERLAGVNIEGEDEMREAARRIRELGARAVLIKGGHLKSHEPGVRRQGSETTDLTANDFLDDAGDVRVVRGDWIETPNVRGTGCMMSSAIAACLANGMPLAEAVAMAKRFVADQIQHSKTEN